MPAVMINGRDDFFFPVETSQQPLFALLGAKPSDKRHIVADGGHYPPQELLVKETVDWLAARFCDQCGAVLPEAPTPRIGT